MLTPFLVYEAGKDWLSTNFHVTHHALHLILGLALTLLFTRIMRMPFGSLRPLVPVAVLELANEAMDFGRYRLSGWPWRPAPTLADIAITLLPPLALLLAWRAARGWRRRPPDYRATEERA